MDRFEAIEDVRAAGGATLRAIAAGLNEWGIPTPAQKGEWSAVQVRRVLARAVGSGLLGLITVLWAAAVI